MSCLPDARPPGGRCAHRRGREHRGAADGRIGLAPGDAASWRDGRAAARPPTAAAGRAPAARRPRARSPRGASTRATTFACAAGEIAELGGARHARRAARSEELIEGSGSRRLLPAFFDPHVHLRTPGQEHKEDLETGTRAAAAGGFGAVLAMPNTDPVLDSAPLLRSLRDAAAREACIPVGFLPAITRGLQGEQLTEMAELRAGGRAGLHRRRAAGSERGDAAQGAAVPAPVRRGARAARGGHDALARRQHARGRRQRGAGPRRDTDGQPSRRWSRATRRLPDTRTRACTSST